MVGGDREIQHFLGPIALTVNASDPRKQQVLHLQSMCLTHGKCSITTGWLNEGVNG